MNENIEEKSMVKINEKSIFYKIKKLIYNIFNKENNKKLNMEIELNKIEESNRNKQFYDYVKNIDNEETKLIKLQKQYRNGEIGEEELTKKQIKDLCGLYDKQIENIEKSNNYKKQRILKFKNKN